MQIEVLVKHRDEVAGAEDHREWLVLWDKTILSVDTKAAAERLRDFIAPSDAARVPSRAAA